MPHIYKDEGVVLKTIKLGEADRIVTVFTRANGKVRAVAKGIRKTKSRFGARLEPFTRAELIIYKGRNLDTITQADILMSFDEIRVDYAKLRAGAALLDVVEKITPDRERAFPTYALLIGGLQALAEGRPNVVPSFLVKLLSISGYHPQLTSCSGCGEDAVLGAFSPALGGAICETCWHEAGDSVRMATADIELMSRLLSSDFGQAADARTTLAMTQALRKYAEYHLERPLKTLHALPAS
ncbi:MAG: DNA repair protein RecO [Actinomycetota bacterium]|nr:DNA repair protein RecO [Actinomycetota bacterium]